ncbi:hypothetical protein ACFSQE_18675 [Vogesella fluminis]|uniref:hypothetical protein n=1 Tax=Vogesella fluminis TaxID=1069161 RepID=UPI001672B27F|nr:hypothetical protein [Vogesella fluminis]
MLTGFLQVCGLSLQSFLTPFGAFFIFRAMANAMFAGMWHPCGQGWQMVLPFATGLWQVVVIFLHETYM